MPEVIGQPKKELKTTTGSFTLPEIGLLRDLTLKKVLWFFIALIPAILALVWILKFTVNIPYWDEWELSPLIIKLRTGGFTINDFWVQHNEHRVVFLRLAVLALAELGGWDIIKEVLFSYLLMVITGVIAWKLLNLTVNKHLRVPLLLISSLLIFNPIQYANWLWGFQIAWFMINVLLISVVWLVTRWPGKRLSFSLTLILTLIATYTASMGVAVWFCVLAGMFGKRQAWKTPYFVIWILATIASIGLYFYNYTFITANRDSLYFLKHPLEFIVYIFKYLASPWGEGAWTPILGGVSFIAFLASGIYLWWLGFRKLPATTSGPNSGPSGPSGSPLLWYSALPWLMIIAYVLINALITGYARASFGIDQAGASRYTSLSLWYWVGGLVILFLAVQQLWQRKPKLKRWLAGSSTIASLFFLSLYGTTYVTSYQNMEDWNDRLGSLAPFLYDYSTAPDPVLLGLYPNAQTLREILWSLDQYQESIFSPQKIAERNSEQAKKLQLLKEPAKKLYTYPSDLMTAATGEALTKATPETVTFTHAGPQPIYISFAAKNFDKQLQTASKNRTLYIQTEHPWYAYIYRDTGNGLNQFEKSLLYPLKDGNGHSIFVTEIPDNLQDFRIDLYYSTGREISDSIKVDVYETP